MQDLRTFGAVIVVAKEPVPGRVKTRLVPPLTHTEAAELATAAIADTLRAAAAVPAALRLLALDGRPGPWLPPGWSITGQPEGDLDVRLVAAFEVAAASVSGPVLLVGMDTPQLQAHQLTAFDAECYDACLGRALDGGYWAIGFRDPARARDTIAGVPMSQPDTGRHQLDRLVAAGLRVQLLDDLTDVDTFDDARAVASGAPTTEFAQTLRAVANRYAPVAG